MISRLIRFFKSPVGAAVLFLLAMFTFFYFVRENRERKERAEAEANEANVLGQMSPEDTPVQPGDSIKSEWVREGELEKFDLPAESPPPPRPPTPAPQPASNQQPQLPQLVHLYTPAPPAIEEPTVPKPPTLFAPPGTLIPCQLIITVDSSSLETPVVGFVTEDVWHNSKLIVPAGTEVHSFARQGRVRDRIEVAGEWKFVWLDGREVRINGIALDRDYDPEADSYAITDGSAGIRGSVHKSDEYLEFKLFAATALAGATRSAETTTRSVFGEFADNSLGNAGLEGASSVAERYAELMLDQIEGDGLFVRVPAGTAFYVYSLQLFEPKLASVAGLKQNQRPTNSWQTALPATDPALPDSIAPQAAPSATAAILEGRTQLERAIGAHNKSKPAPRQK